MKRFLRLWFLVFFSYSTMKLILDLALMGWIDLRPAALWELVLLPLGQTIVFWVVTRRTRKGEYEARLAATSS